ncbi:LuxR family transcriptional regulator [Bradyrhizobium sp. SSUT112]|uniref:helix-turn-helix transcriptional regulator n=1 Tax=Bradyrhizobium sp. SSUT112 TaxID=3040604 RepID=UPI002448398A|nr:LuxR family transcriptional regulator [Bradyrhizobium sp. SSUT112]MDH2356698.1 LuxR family transcriptional regulator [Bradyrhizobium sp. SSUT112]
MADVTAALSLSWFAYLALPSRPGGVPNLISTYPSSWTALYLQRGYDSIDPVVRRAIRQPKPFRWGLGIEQQNQSDSERTLFEEAAKFGIRCGFTFPIHDGRGATAALSFATDEHRTVFDRSLLEHAHSLRLIAWFSHAHAKRFWTIDRMVGGVVLSPREYECLEWSARGKSAGEIGIILRIAERTAGFHLDNARAKLGVRSSSHRAANRIKISKIKTPPTINTCATAQVRLPRPLCLFLQAKQGGQYDSAYHPGVLRRVRSRARRDTPAALSRFQTAP